MNTRDITILGLISLLLLASGMAVARQLETPAQKAQFQAQWMQNNLAITEVQGKKIYSIILHFAQLDETPGADKKANSRAKDADIRAILTHDEYRIYHQHSREMLIQEAQEAKQATPQNAK